MCAESTCNFWVGGAHVVETVCHPLCSRGARGRAERRCASGRGDGPAGARREIPRCLSGTVEERSPGVHVSPGAPAAGAARPAGAPQGVFRGGGGRSHAGRGCRGHAKHSGSVSRTATPGPIRLTSGSCRRSCSTGRGRPGTMTDFYKEISYGAFTVTGTVSPWQALPQTDTIYEGGAGLQRHLRHVARSGDFLKDTLDTNDAAVDFGQYDNDGPDGHAQLRRRRRLRGLRRLRARRGGRRVRQQQHLVAPLVATAAGRHGPVYTTADNKTGGGKIKVNDYVIMPALACDGSTMIQIGVFAHEFGHAFGLPDLYDTDDDNGDSEGIGNWCLMAGGSWGGDGQSPERPAHMSAWSKEFLGWVSPTTVTTELNPASLKSVEDERGRAQDPHLRHAVLPDREPAEEAVRREAPAGGLLVWKIDQTVVTTASPTTPSTPTRTTRASTSRRRTASPISTRAPTGATPATSSRGRPASASSTTRRTRRARARSRSARSAPPGPPGAR